MITIIYAYSLKKDTDVEEFKKWSVEEDQKTVRSFKSVESFEVNLIKGLEQNFNVFEVIKVDSWERWREINNLPEMKKLKPKFKEFVDKSSVVKFYGEKIE
ncbi:MAG: hypothetical protein ISS14_03235 [Actinobacteria bacterium]|nr:hypothetical protein [Actinomycetota bacterium]MBL7123887.1 hypothetical protein [Actinomycetota bacterium]